MPKSLPLGQLKDSAQGLLPLPIIYQTASPILNLSSSSQAAEVANDSKSYTRLTLLFRVRLCLHLCSHLFSSDPAESGTPHDTRGHFVRFGPVCYSLPFKCSAHQRQTDTAQPRVCFSAAHYYRGKTATQHIQADAICK